MSQPYPPQEKDEDIDIIRFFLLLPITYKLYVLEFLHYYPEYLIMICGYIPSLLENTNQINCFWLDMYFSDRIFVRKHASTPKRRAKIIKKCSSNNTTFGSIYIDTINNRENYYDRTCRTIHLTNALAKIGLTIRGDSRLCENWINKEIETKWTLDSVVDMCAEMRWLYDHTPYKRELDNKIWFMWDEDEDRSYLYFQYEPGVRKDMLRRY